MPWFWIIAFLAVPRFILLMVYDNSYLLQQAYHQFHFPTYGFLFLPLTTLAYAWMLNTGQPATGIGLLLLIITVAIDLGSILAAVFHRRGH